MLSHGVAVSSNSRDVSTRNVLVLGAGFSMISHLVFNLFGRTQQHYVAGKHGTDSYTLHLIVNCISKFEFLIDQRGSDK